MSCQVADAPPCKRVPERPSLPYEIVAGQCPIKVLKAGLELPLGLVEQPYEDHPNVVILKPKFVYGIPDSEPPQVSQLIIRRRAQAV